MSYSMSDLLQLVVSEGASDLHIRVGTPPVIRVHGILHRVEGPSLTPEDTEELMRSITSEDHIQQRARTRRRGLRLCLRRHGAVPRQRLQGEGQLRPGAAADSQQAADAGANRPAALSAKELLYKPRGLVLVTGPTGSGKTTTLASMINIINEERDEAHIITIEDPIEYYHQHKKAIVTQREIGVDVPNFAEALRRALRQDPDVILVGENALFLIAMFGVLWKRASGRRQRAVTAHSQTPQIRDALVDYLAGLNDQTAIRAFVKSNRADFVDTLLEFHGTVGGSARDRLCDLALELALVHDWCHDASSPGPPCAEEGLCPLIFRLRVRAVPAGCRRPFAAGFAGWRFGSAVVGRACLGAIGID